MLTTFLPIIMTLMAQTDHVEYGLVPENAETFEITLRNGGTVFGAVRLDGRWVDDPTQINDRVLRFDVVPDTPWDATTQPITVARKTAQPIKEPNFRRRERIVRGWKENGYRVVETNDGPKYYPESEIRLAERAAQMDYENNPQATPTTQATLQRGPTTSAPTEEKTFAQQWGAHLGISLGGLLLISVVLKTMVFRP